MVENFQTKVKELEKNHNLSHYEALQKFMFERIIERISVSKYQDNFILKGGLLLSAMYGIDNRTTNDMDTTIKGISVEPTTMVNVLNDILSIELNDKVEFDLVDVTNIRETDEYGGNKYHIIGKISNLKVVLEIDISTGDEVTPKELKYKYPLFFSNKSVLISSYNLETILAEKIETLLRRGKFNSRMKDYYDVYYILTNLYDDIDFQIMNMSMKKTFTIRESFTYLNDAEQIIDAIIESNKIKELWNIYSKKNYYATSIEFLKILNLIKQFLKKIN